MCKVLTRDIFYPANPVAPGTTNKMTAANPAVWWSVSPSPISMGHGGELSSAVSISHLWQGECKTRWGCVLPCWVLLINIRNCTRGYEALNWSVISYVGFAKCLSPDHKRETSGPASVEELPCESRTPPRDARCCCPSPWMVLCPTQGCTGMYSMARFLLPAPGCRQRRHLSPPHCSLFNIYALKW